LSLTLARGSVTASPETERIETELLLFSQFLLLRSNSSTVSPLPQALALANVTSPGSVTASPEAARLELEYVISVQSDGMEVLVQAT
jgi:hypothetical protein